MFFSFSFLLKNKYFSVKIKSAPTEVSAPKNANSNCRQTKNKLTDNSPNQPAEFAILPNS